MGGGPGMGHAVRAAGTRELTDARFKWAGVGLKPDRCVARALGISKNAVSQFRSRRGVPKSVYDASSKVIEDRKTFHTAFHKGTGVWMITIYGEGRREITFSKFFAEIRLGRRLRKDERVQRGTVIRDGEPFGWAIMHQRNS